MTELAESFLLLDGDESFVVPEIEDYEITGNYESPASLSPPIDMNRAGKQMCVVDFSDAIDANFLKRMEIDENSRIQATISTSDFTFTQKKRPSASSRSSLLRKAFSPEQLAFQRRLAARKSAKQNNRRSMIDSVDVKDPVPSELGPFICIW